MPAQHGSFRAEEVDVPLVVATFGHDPGPHEEVAPPRPLMHGVHSARDLELLPRVHLPKRFAHGFLRHGHNHKG